MEPGICYIKKEFLIEDVKVAAKEVVDSNKRKNEDDDIVDKPEAASAQPNKWQKTGRKDKKRGQNKNRPVYKEDRTLHLCHSLVNGPGVEECTHPNCRYVHNLEEYLASKGEDLGAVCHVYKEKGYCPRGVTCRFAKNHLDAQGRNVKAPDYDAAKAATTCNGITSELQVRLRKREYDFSKCKNLIARYDQLREERKQQKQAAGADKSAPEQNDSGAKASEVEVADKEDATECAAKEKEEADEGAAKTEPPTQSSNGEKPVGAVVDENEGGPERDAKQKPPVDFAHKLVLSPLTTVGNLPFRRICKEYGADITCGEMACAVPLVKGLTQEWALTKRHTSEDVFGVQLCGNNPTIIAQAAQLMHETAKVDYVDLNIGCPIDLIYQQGGGSALMRRTNILELSVRTCSTLTPQIPFTVKMRTGVYADKSVAHELLPLVEEWGAAAVTLHGRSREQRYTKNANWAYIEECAAKAKQMPVIGNGDILNYMDYNERQKIAPHVSSVMIGRGALIKPWIFEEIKQQKHLDPTSSERFAMLRKYANYGLEHWGSDTKGVETTRRFLLEWQSFLYRYIPYDLMENPPQQINQRPQKFRGRDEMETLMSSPNSADWVKLSEMLLGPVPEGFSFVPKHKANSY